MYYIIYKIQHFKQLFFIENRIIKLHSDFTECTVAIHFYKAALCSGSRVEIFIFRYFISQLRLTQRC